MSTGFPFRNVEHEVFTGTTSVITDGPAAIKNVLPKGYTGAFLNELDVEGEGAAIYLENGWNPRDGFNHPTAVVEIDGDDPVSAKVIRLTDAKYVVFSNITNAKLEATVVDISGTVPAPGTIATINNADTDSWDAVAIGTAGTHFALIYRDEGGDDFVYGRIGSVSGTTITMGDEKALDGAEVGTENAGERYGVCEPRPGVLLFAWADNDDDLATVAAPYSGVTVGTLGTQSEVSADAPTQIACCPMGDNKVFVAYSDGGDSDFIHCRVATVSAAGAIGTYGTEYDLFVSDAVSTYLEAHFLTTDKVIVTGEDGSNDPYAITLTASSTTLTRGTITVFLTGSVTDVSSGIRDPSRGFIQWDNGTNGQILSFAIGTTTVTADATIDNYVETSSAGCTTGGLVYGGNGKAVSVYQDADSDLAMKVGTYFENRIIDVRSATASIDYSGRILPVFDKKETLAKI